MNTMTNRISALFEDRTQAEQAVRELERLGVSESQLSIIARHADGGADGGVDGDEHSSAGSDVAKGTLAGAGVGALFGIAAALIPGVGPFITAGSLLATSLGAVGGGAAAGAIVGGTTGLIASALARAGYSEEESHYYGTAVERGSTLLVVDTTGLNEAGVRDVLNRFGGRVGIA